MSGRVAVVTGAAGGIGAAVCQLLRSDGWRVVGVDIRFDGLAGDERFADVTSRDSLAEAISDLERIDGVVSNAAVMVSDPLIEMTDEAWDAALATNLSATFRLIGLTHERLAAVEGSVVAVSSVHAFATSSNTAAYAASKAGLLGLVRGAAIELASEGIRVNAVLPGATSTPMFTGSGLALETLIARTPLRRIADPSEVAESVRFLLDTSSASFVTGQTLVVDGGALARLGTE